MEEEYIGTDKNRFQVNTRQKISETSCDLISQANRSINIMLYDYDDILLPVTRVDELLSSFIRQHERSRLRYLCSESDILCERGGKLIQLARRFSTFIKLRQLPDDLKPIHEQFIIIDGESCIQTQDHRSYDYYANLHNRARARQLNNHFEALWERSSAAAGIHVTGL
jgi:hypothetical protein